MNILFIQFSHITKCFNGAETYHHNMAKWLQSLGHETISTSSILTDSGEFDGVKYSRYSFDLVTWADVIITTPGKVRKPIKGKEIIYIQHNQNREPWDLSFGSVIYCAQHVADKIKYKCKRSLVKWPFNRYQGAEPLPLNPEGKITLVNCNRNKGGGLIEGFAKKLPDMQFLCIKVGYGHFVECKMPNVEYRTGGHHDLREVLKDTSIVIMPSEKEGLPTLALECASLGVPLIMSDIPAAKEINAERFRTSIFPEFIRRAKLLYHTERRMAEIKAEQYGRVHIEQLKELRKWF